MIDTQRAESEASIGFAPSHGDMGLLAVMAGVAVVFYAAPWPAVYVPALLVLAGLTWYRLELAVWPVIAFAPAFMVTKHIGSKEFPPSEIFLVLDLAVAAVVAFLPQRRERLDWAALRRTPFLAPSTVFLLAGTLSAALAVDHAEAFRAWRLVILEPIAFFALLLLLQRSIANWVVGFGVLVAAGVVVGAIAVGQFITRRDLSVTAGSSLLRAKALYGSPDNLGLLLDRVIPMWLAWMLLWPFRAARERLLVVVAGTILFLALVFTFSRGAWLAVALACVALAATRTSGRWVVAGVIVLAAVAIAYRGPQTIDALRSGHSNTVHERGYLWQSAAHMIRDHPIVGIGPDNFLHYYAPRYDKYPKCAFGLGYISPHALDQPCLSHPHNEFLDLWLSTGILGLAAFVWLQIVFWRRSLLAFGRSVGVTRILLAGSMAGMLATLVHGLVDNSYFLEDLCLIFWMLCGFVSFIATRPEESA